MRTSSSPRLVALALGTLVSARAFAQTAEPATPPPPTVQQPAAAAPASAGQQERVYRQGESVFSLGLALGGMNGAAGDTVVPPIVATFDYGLHPDISIGGIASYYRSRLGYNGLGEWHYTYLAFGARADYHFGRFVPVEKLDLYGGLMLAYGILSVSAPSSSNPYLAAAATGASSNILVWGVNLGARYFFTPSLAAQIELGVGLGNLGASLAYKF